jgi:hypothetical protein
MRYCKRITDSGVNAIAGTLQHLYSLDLSFCTKLTASSVCNLLESRHETLSELRLQQCRQLKIARDPNDDDDDGHDGRGGRHHTIARGARDGQSILKSLKSPVRSRFLQQAGTQQQQSNLSILDVRFCGGQPNMDVGYPDSDPFVRGMNSLQFEQKTPGFFSRPARWNASVQARLLEQLESSNVHFMPSSSQV